MALLAFLWVNFAFMNEPAPASVARSYREGRITALPPDLLRGFQQGRTP